MVIHYHFKTSDYIKADGMLLAAREGAYVTMMKDRKKIVADIQSFACQHVDSEGEEVKEELTELHSELLTIQKRIEQFILQYLQILELIQKRPENTPPLLDEAMESIQKGKLTQADRKLRSCDYIQEKLTVARSKERISTAEIQIICFEAGLKVRLARLVSASNGPWNGQQYSLLEYASETESLFDLPPNVTEYYLELLMEDPDMLSVAGDQIKMFHLRYMTRLPNELSAKGHLYFARWLFLRGLDLDAMEEMKEGIGVLSDLYEKGNTRVRDQLLHSSFHYLMLLNDRKNYSGANERANKTMAMIQNLDSEEYILLKALVLNQRGYARWKSNNLDAAEKDFREALILFSVSVDLPMELRMFSLAQVHNNLGIVLYETDPEDSLHELKKAYDYLESMSDLHDVHNEMRICNANMTHASVMLRNHYEARRII